MTTNAPAKPLPAQAAPLSLAVEQKSESPLSLALRAFRRNRRAILALIFFIMIILASVFANLLTRYDPIQRDAKVRLQGPSVLHPMGTDTLGRDMLARVLYGGRISLQVGFYSVLVSVLIGVPLGLVAGYAGGQADTWIMRFVDLILAFPGLLLAIWLVSMLGANMGNVITAIAIGSIPTYARITRGIALSTRELDYVIAARSIGARPIRILISHVFPSVVGSLIVLTSLSISGSIIAGASLSFLGLGVRPPTPEWGAMLADGRGYLRNAWWMSVFPGMMITLVVLAANVLGDGVRDALDPRLQTRQ
jgi:peptide/nickel transport system permease protein